MRKEVTLESNSEIKDFAEYSENKLAIAKVCVLSTAPNSHSLNISEEVLRRDIGSIRGNFLVADMQFGDATTHTSKEVPVGYFLPDEPIEFEEVGAGEDKVVKAWAYAVLSKQYAKEAYQMFVEENHRATSIEMTVETTAEDENEVVSFDAYGSTILGKVVAPSCKEAEISLVRFAKEANDFFNKETKEQVDMAESKSYKIDKSKDSLSDTPWGDVDKTAQRDKIMEASNRAELVKAVYALVEEGWEDAPSEHLKYPIMQLKGDTFVYNRDALASALGYAKKENETSVINKVEKIYKDLGLDEEDSKGKEDDAKMSKEIEFAAVELSDLWCKLEKALRIRYDWDWYIAGIYEEDNQKFAIIRNREGDRYRLDFSYTEEGLTLAEDMVKVEIEFVETNEMKRFACPVEFEYLTKFADEETEEDGEGEEDESKDEDKEDTESKDESMAEPESEPETKMSEEEMTAKIAQLEKDIEERDNIIMKNNEELEVLRAFKKGIDDKEKAMSVEAILSEITGFVNDEKMSELRTDGLSCDNIDGWANKVKAIAFEAVKDTKPNKKKGDVFSFAAPKDTENKKKVSGDVWSRLAEELN